MNSQHEKYYKDFVNHCSKIIQKTTINNLEPPKQKAARIKTLEKSYTDWFEYYLPHYALSKSAWYHKRFANKMINNKIVFIILRIFRGGAKSVHANVGVPLFLYLVKKDLGFMLLIGENSDKAKKLISDIQAELQFNKRLEQDYGKRFKYGDWADGNFSTIDGTHFFSLGIGQSPRGIRDMEKRPDYISVDDIDTKKRCKNPKLTKEAFEYLKEDIWGTFGRDVKRYVQANNMFSKTSVVYLMSEHFKRVIKKYKENDRPIRHHVIIAKAINDKGESGWPERYTIEYWLELMIDMGTRAFTRENQDTPIEEGTVFKNEWIQYKKRLALNQYDKLAVYGDLSYSDQACHKAMIFGGKIGKEFHVIACMVRQTTRAMPAIWLYDLYESMNLKKYNVKYQIEGNFAQGIIFLPDFDAEGDKRGYHVPVVGDKKAKGDKYERIESMSGFFERLNVFFNLAEKGSNDFQELEDQILAFEKGSGSAVDGPDALNDLIQELNSGVPFDPSKWKTTSRKDVIKRKKNRF